MARGLRVIAGSAGGLHLVAPKGARPTTDRVRESLFASLADAVVDADVLDLFAGSGGLGIEALSRGARRATFVDHDREAIAAIGRNLETTRLSARALVARSDVDGWVRRRVGAGPSGARFDLVFLDPPYEVSDTEVGRLLGLLDEAGVGSGSTVVVERRAGSGRVELPSGWLVARERRYGDTLTLVLTVPAPS